MRRRSSKPDPPKAAHSHVWSLFGWMIPPSACLAWLKRFSGFCVLTEHVCVAVFPGGQSAGPSGSQPAPGRLVLVTMLPCNPFERLHEGTVCHCRLDLLPYKSNLLYNNIKKTPNNYINAHLLNAVHQEWFNLWIHESAHTNTSSV